MIYLYVKQHLKTKLKYFGKTNRDPYKYLGSGLHWKRHINKHGLQHVETNQVWCFQNQEECTKFALEYSRINNIIESNEWANLKDEDGLAGWGVGNKHNVGRKLSDETKRKIANSHIGLNYLKGRKQSDEHIKAKTAARKANGDWLSDETKSKIQKARGTAITVYFKNGMTLKLPSISSLGKHLNVTSTTAKNIYSGATPKEKYNIIRIETTNKEDRA